MNESKPIVYLYGFSTLLEDKLKNLINIIENHPELYKKCIIYFIFTDVKKNTMSIEDTFEIVKILIINSNSM